MNLGWPDSVPGASKAIQLFDTDTNDDWIFPQTQMAGAGNPIWIADTQHGGLATDTPSGIGRNSTARERLISEAREINVPVREI